MECSYNLSYYGDIVSNYNENLQRIRQVGDDAKKTIISTENKLQFACDIFSYFRLTFKELDDTPLKDLLKSTSDLDNSKIYIIASKAFKEFKKTFTALIKRCPDIRYIQQFASTESCRDFIIHSKPRAASIDFYRNFYFKFIRIINPQPSLKKLKVDYLCNESLLEPTATVEDLKKYFNSTNTPESDGEKEDDENIKYGLLGYFKKSEMQTAHVKYTIPETYVKIDALPSIHHIRKTLAENDEVLSSTTDGEVTYWHTERRQNSNNPTYSSPLAPLDKCTDFMMDVNSYYSVFVGYKPELKVSEVKVFKRGPNGFSLNPSERKPTEHKFSFENPIKAMRLYNEIVAFGFSNGGLKIFELNEDHSVSTIRNITSKIKFQTFISRELPRIETTCVDYPLGNACIYSVDLSEKLVLASGGHRTVFLGRLDGKASVVIKGFGTTASVSKFFLNYSFTTATTRGTIEVWDLPTQVRTYVRMDPNDQGILDVIPDPNGFYALPAKSNAVFYYDTRDNTIQTPSWQFSLPSTQIYSMAKDGDNLILTESSGRNKSFIRLKGKSLFGDSLTV